MYLIKFAFLAQSVIFLLELKYHTVFCNFGGGSRINKTRTKVTAENRDFRVPITGCGLQKVRCEGTGSDNWCNPNARIIGGSETYRGEYPWMVLLINTYNHNRKQFCAGTLLDSQHVLTANHCVFDFNTLNLMRLRAILGDHDLRTTSDGRHEERRISNIFKHPKWNRKTNEHDIAIIKLRRPVNFTQYIQPICLSELNTEELLYDTVTSNYDNYNYHDDQEDHYYRDENPHQVYVTIAGWGRTNINSTKKSPVLMKTMIPLKNHEECQKAYVPYVVTRNMFCAGGDAGADGFDACVGDSGGPIMHKNDYTGRWEQLGVISWGNNCYKLPGVYTRVENYLSWIDQTISNSRLMPSKPF